MKHLLRSAAGFLLLGSAAYGQLILGDDYNVAGSGTGFVLGSGVNSGINPPTTRMTGSAAANMRYILPEATKPAAKHVAPPKGKDELTKRETLELVRAYYKITDPAVRKSISDMVRSMAKSGSKERA